MTNNNKLLLIIVFVLLLVIIGGGTFFFLKSQTASAAPAAVETEVKKKAKTVKSDYSYFFTPGEAFVTNVYESDALVKMSVVLEIDEEKQESFLDEQIAVIRDIILNTIRECTETDLRKLDIQQVLSDKICKRLNEKYDVNFFVQAYITDIIIQ